MTCGAVEFKVQLRVYVDMSRQEKSFPPTTRRFGDFLRSRMAVEASFLTRVPDLSSGDSTMAEGRKFSTFLRQKWRVLEGNPLLFSPNTLFVSFQQKATVTKVEVVAS